MPKDLQELIDFMSKHQDRRVFGRMIWYFSTTELPGVKSKYLHPRELKAFWESLSKGEKDFWRVAFSRESTDWWS